MARNVFYLMAWKRNYCIYDRLIGDVNGVKAQYYRTRKSCVS